MIGTYIPDNGYEELIGPAILAIALLLAGWWRGWFIDDEPDPREGSSMFEQHQLYMTNIKNDEPLYTIEVYDVDLEQHLADEHWNDYFDGKGIHAELELYYRKAPKDGQP